MDLEVLGPDGTPLARTDAALQPVRTAGGDTRRLAFTVPLNPWPPPGSMVRATYHAAARSETGSADVAGCRPVAHEFPMDTTDEV
jgi:hypothetical protein